VPTHNTVNPDRTPRFEARAVIIRVRRVVGMASSLAILLVLLVAGAASAADGLDLVEAAPAVPVVPVVDPEATIEPITVTLRPAKDRAVTAAVKALPKGSAQVPRTIVREVSDRVVAVEPVPIPAVNLPNLSEGPDRVVQPRRPHPRVAEDEKPTADLRQVVASSATPDNAPPVAADRPPQFDDDSLLRPLQPAAPLGQFDLVGGAAAGGSGAGPGPLFADGSLAAVRPARRSGLLAAARFAMPRGLTPRSVVPPG
jgi:hypothetical protein